MKNRSTKSALLLTGAAVGAAAAWVGKRRSAAPVSPSDDETSDEYTSVTERTPRTSDFVELGGSDLIEIDGPELPIGRSADPEIDDALQRYSLREEATTGGALLGDAEPTNPRIEAGALDEIWDAAGGMSDGEQTEGYDAVSPEELGSVWLSRATQTTHEERPHVIDPDTLPYLEDLSVS